MNVDHNNMHIWKQSLCRSHRPCQIHCTRVNVVRSRVSRPHCNAQQEANNEDRAAMKYNLNVMC